MGDNTLLGLQDPLRRSNGARIRRGGVEAADHGVGGVEDIVRPRGLRGDRGEDHGGVQEGRPRRLQAVHRRQGAPPQQVLLRRGLRLRPTGEPFSLNISLPTRCANESSVSSSICFATSSLQLRERGWGNERLFPAGEVDPIPQWVFDLVVRPIVRAGIISDDDFINSAVIEEYQPRGKQIVNKVA